MNLAVTSAFHSPRRIFCSTFYVRDSPRASNSCQFITSIPLSTVSGEAIQRSCETDRKWLGATSAPKIGVTDALAPSPNPKINLQTSSCHHLWAVPLPMAPMIQRHAEMQIAPLRPIFFDWSGSENQQPEILEVSNRVRHRGWYASISKERPTKDGSG